MLCPLRFPGIVQNTGCCGGRAVEVHFPLLPTTTHWLSKLCISNYTMPRIQLSGGHAAVVERLLTDPDTTQYGSNQEIIQSALKAHAPPIISGTDTLLDLQTTSRPLSTGCPAFDNAFFHSGGGMRPGQLIEFCGTPASGKTQLCLTMAATTALRGERVVYIDTANAFSATRVSTILQHHHLPSSSVPPNTTTNTDINTNIDKALACIEVHHCHTIHALLSLLESLLREKKSAPSITYTQKTKPSMVIVDSLSSLVGTILGGQQHFQGHALLSLTGVTLKKVAASCKAAVIVTNHLVGSGGGYGSVSGGGGGNIPPPPPSAAMSNANISPTTTALLLKKPAMGESWRCQPHVRIQLVVGAVDGCDHEHYSAVVIGEDGSSTISSTNSTSRISEERVGVACLLTSTQCPPGAQVGYRIHSTMGIIGL